MHTLTHRLSMGARPRMLDEARWPWQVCSHRASSARRHPRGRCACAPELGFLRGWSSGAPSQPLQLCSRLRVRPVLERGCTDAPHLFHTWLSFLRTLVRRMSREFLPSSAVRCPLTLPESRAAPPVVLGPRDAIRADTNPHGQMTCVPHSAAQRLAPLSCADWAAPNGRDSICCNPRFRGACAIEAPRADLIQVRHRLHTTRGATGGPHAPVPTLSFS